MRRVLEYLVVMFEALIALAAMFWAWRCWRSSEADAFRLGLRGLLTGMTWCAFLHGFLFGVVQTEGPHPGGNAPLLLGFGIVVAFLPGVPVGLIVGFLLYLARRTGS
jgi:hypothetical protein